MLRDIRLIQPNIIRPFSTKKFREKKTPEKIAGTWFFFGRRICPIFVQYFEEKIVSSVKQQARQGQQHVTLAIAWSTSTEIFPDHKSGIMIFKEKNFLPGKIPPRIFGGFWLGIFF
jgi:hypothetical protein